MQDKATHVDNRGGMKGLCMSTKKTKVLNSNVRSKEPVRVRDTNLAEVYSFTYLGRIFNSNGGSERDVASRTGKV